MRNILRMRKDKQSNNTTNPASSSPRVSQNQSSSRRPSEASFVSIQRRFSDEEESFFDDDASTIRPTRSYAGSVFSDTASTLNEDAYACLGPQDDSNASSSTTRGTQMPSSSAQHQNFTERAAANALGTTHAARGVRDTMTMPQNYWHEPQDLVPFNPFEEVARLSQRERVELAIKNAKGPQYNELNLKGGGYALV